MMGHSIKYQIKNRYTLLSDIPLLVDLGYLAGLETHRKPRHPPQRPRGRDRVPCGPATYSWRDTFPVRRLQQSSLETDRAY